MRRHPTKSRKRYEPENSIVACPERGLGYMGELAHRRRQDLKMKTLLIFLLLSVPASAQTIWTSTTTGYSNCCAEGACWMERGSMCHSNPNDRVSPSAIGSGIVTVTNSPAPKCEDGWSLVSDGSRPMCARDLKEPVR
jgi:hypothetical protein